MSVRRRVWELRRRVRPLCFLTKNVTPVVVVLGTAPVGDTAFRCVTLVSGIFPADFSMSWGYSLLEDLLNDEEVEVGGSACLWLLNRVVELIEKGWFSQGRK